MNRTISKIVEGRMVNIRLNIKIPPMKGEAIVRSPQPEPPSEEQSQDVDQQ